MRITVFTPAYNRGYIIETLYHSLQRQTFTDFEWVVVDDGSADDTQERFERILSEENPFPIRYVKTQNGGKHRAINCGVQLAEGELFYIVDSDDHLSDHALETIDRVEKSIPLDQKKQFAGVCGQRGYSLTNPIGTTFEGEILDVTALQRLDYGIDGDKAEAIYTEIMRKYPFPEFEGERFLTECVVWDKMAADGYLLRFFNEVTTICNYLPDGLTSQGDEVFYRNPRGYALYLYQSSKYGKLQRLNKWYNYLKFYYALRDRFSIIQMGRMLHMNPMVFWLRMFGLRVFDRLYNS